MRPSNETFFSQYKMKLGRRYILISSALLTILIFCFVKLVCLFLTQKSEPVTAVASQPEDGNLDSNNSSLSSSKHFPMRNLSAKLYTPDASREQLFIGWRSQSHVICGHESAVQNSHAAAYKWTGRNQENATVSTANQVSVGMSGFVGETESFQKGINFLKNKVAARTSRSARTNALATEHSQRRRYSVAGGALTGFPGFVHLQNVLVEKSRFVALDLDSGPERFECWRLKPGFFQVKHSHCFREFFAI